MEPISSIAGVALASLVGMAIGFYVAKSAYQNPYVYWTLRCNGYDIKLSPKQVIVLLREGLDHPDMDLALELIRATGVLREDSRLLGKLTDENKQFHLASVHLEERSICVDIQTRSSGATCGA